MTALRPPVVNRGETFEQDLAAIHVNYPEIRSVVDELCDVLRDSWGVPHRPIANGTENVYAVRLDYPPHGSNGLGLFLVTYHATPEAFNKMSEPLRTYTLLSIVTR